MPYFGHVHLDKAILEFHMSDRQDGGAIKVTPEMIKVGLRVYEEWLPWDAPRSLDEANLMEDVFRAMYRHLGGVGAPSGWSLTLGALFLRQR